MKLDITELFSVNYIKYFLIIFTYWLCISYNFPYYENIASDWQINMLLKLNKNTK